MEIEVALKMRNFAALQTQISHGEFVSSAVMAEEYEPAAADYQTIVNWLTSAGLSVTSQDPHHLAVFATGTVGQIAKAFQVNFAKVTASGVEYTSAVTAPSVPSTVASLLVGINGLQPHLRKSHHLIPYEPNSATGNNPPFLPAQIAKAYNANGLGATGAGQTIAIVIDNVPATSDLTSFWSTSGVSQSLANITFVPVGGGALPPTDTAGEATLDVEWSSSMAPAAKVRVYATQDLADVSLDKAYQQIFNDLPNYPGLRQMSLSYGAAEDETPASQIETDSQYFAELANAGVTILVSSGDGGSNPNGSRSSASVETPASDPSVTAVGGTTLHVNASTGAESSETGWSDSGGGVSTVFSRPSWQTGAGVPSGTMRLVPDVASDGDPNTGGLVILRGRSLQIGGTSLGTPTWAGYCALINQSRTASQGSLGFLGPKIYPLIGTGDFRDITSGSNGDYTAGAGYDLVTGIGVPDVANLLQALGGSNITITPPSIVTPPANANVTAGQNASFTVAATGAGTLAYQWQILASSSTWSNLTNNTTYSGATTTALTVNATTVAMSGAKFLCVVTNSAGSISSAAATLTVNPVPTPPPPPSPVAPAITRQPQSETVDIGQTASFGATVTGTAPLTYQWKKNGTALTGATNATLVIAGVQTSTAGNYTLFVSNSAGNVTSAVAILTVDSPPAPPTPPSPPTRPTPPVVAPTIFQQPHSETVTTGQTAVFGVFANGTPPLSYQWSKNGAAITGATNYYLAIPDAQTANAGNYTVVVSNSAGHVTSSAAILTVNPPPPPVAPAIVRQPQSETITVGQTAQFGVFASGTGPLAYQWSFNGTVITGATNNTLTIRDAQTTNAGNYTVNVSNSVGNVTSTIAVLTVNPAPAPRSPAPPVSGTPPVISTQPQSQTATIGGNVTFSVVATGTGTLDYQWFKNDGYIRGATSANLTLTDVQLSDSAYYTVVVYNNAGFIWSNSATLTVNLLSGALGGTSDAGLFFPANGVPAGLQPLQGRDATEAQAWLNQLTQVAADNQAQTAALNQIQANFGDNLSTLFTLISFQNLTASVDFDTYVAPWLLENDANAKVFYVDSSGDIYIQAITVSNGSSSVASTIELPVEFLKSLVDGPY
jgi:kumamolisin